MAERSISEPPEVEILRRQQVNDVLQANHLRLKPAFSARHLWERVFTPTERARLGGDLETAYRVGGTVGMWVRLHGVSQHRAVIDAARALGVLDEGTHAWLLRETGESVDDPDDILLRVVPTADLVMIERPRRLFWAGTEVLVDWHTRDAAWNYVWELGRAAKRNEALTRDVFSEDFRANYLSKQKHKLSGLDDHLLGLTERIEAAGIGTQRLDIPVDRIRLFQVDEQTIVREWTGRN